MPLKKRTTVAAAAAAAAAAVPLSEADANSGSATNNTTTEPAEKPAPKSRKRKSDAVDGAAEAAEAPAPKKQSTKAEKDPLPDLSGIHLDGDEDMSVSIYDTCDTARTKIRAILKKDGVTKAAFLCALVRAAYPSGSTHKIAYNSLSDFMKKKGPTSGNTSSVFYAAYVFFEKLRIVTKKPKGKTRLEMELLWPDGFDTRAQMASYIVPTYATLTMDQYGKVHCY